MTLGAGLTVALDRVAGHHSDLMTNYGTRADQVGECAAAIAGALRGGAAEPAASLAAETGIAVYLDLPEFSVTR
jgi:hypothetical protein